MLNSFRKPKTLTIYNLHFALVIILILIISSSKLENENFQFPCKSSIAKLTKTLNLNGLFVCFIDYNCLLMNISCDSSALKYVAESLDSRYRKSFLWQSSKSFDKYPLQ